MYLIDSIFFGWLDELTVSGNQDDTDKADMRIVQASSQEVSGYEREGAILNYIHSQSGRSPLTLC